MGYDPDHQAIEQERQRWVSDQLSCEASIITDLTIDPDAAYRDWRRQYEQTGSKEALKMMLEYVR